MQVESVEWYINAKIYAQQIYSEAAKTQTTYVIPGPRIYPGFGGTGTTPTNAPGGSTTQPVTTTTKASTTSPSAPPVTTAPSTGGAAHYAQCGGTGWSVSAIWVKNYISDIETFRNRAPLLAHRPTHATRSTM